ncbi:hypothetical protein GCM10009550_66140 [Actinocorallia libanotica]|uniref:Recombination endonuclease VII n=1 Tax=Actinocorallia libanotica TaxID=46162 RepID=A0ABP4CCM8_9ACTN
MDTKWCTGCGQDKSVSEFGTDRRRADGLARQCKPCVNAAALLNRRKRLAGQGRVVQEAVPAEGPIENGKKCPDCAEFKPIEAFGLNKQNRDGRAFYCKICARRRSQQGYRDRLARQGIVVREKYDVPPGHKRCPTCEEIKPHTEWHRAKVNADGFASECKACRKVRSAREHLKRSYGLTPEDVRKMFEFQDGLCAICVEGPAEHVDHDHETGDVRELLCFNCNTLLGKAGDDWRRLQRAEHYLLWHKLGHIPVAEGLRRLQVVRRGLTGGRSRGMRSEVKCQ